MGDHSHHVAYLKFRLDQPGRPLSVTLRLFNAGNPTGDSGRICLVTDPWDRKTLRDSNRPAMGEELFKIGRIVENQVIECPLEIPWHGQRELSLAIDPTSLDGTDYLSRESSHPPELVIEYEIQE